MLLLISLFLVLFFGRFSEYGGRSQEELALYPELVLFRLTKIRGRIWKRIIAPVTLSVGMIFLSVMTSRFSWFFLLSLPVYIGTTSAFGYGPNDAIAKAFHYDGDETWKKILRRSVWSLARTVSSATFALFTGTWGLFVLQLIIGLLVTCYLGVKNPLKAPLEEDIVNAVSIFFVPFYLL